MTIRATGALLCAVGFLCASSGLVAAKDGIILNTSGGGFLPKQGKKTPDTANPNSPTSTIRVDTGNMSDKKKVDRMGGGGGTKGAAPISDQANSGVLTKKKN
jgi:hypothetical protein